MKNENTPKPTKNFLNDNFKQISPLGSYQFFIIITITLFLLQQYTQFTQLLIGFFILSSFAIPIRLIFFRQRPDKTKYKNIIEKIHAASFPSLHAARATFLVIFFINYFEKELFISLFLSLLGILVIYSRIYNKRHYPTDILAGIIFGIITIIIIGYYL